MDQCPGEVLTFAKRWWHLKLIGLWQGHDESNHVGGVKINGVASGKTLIWKEVGTEEELHCSFDYLLWDPLVHFLEFFTCLGILFLFHSGGRLRKFGRRDLVGRPHSIRMVQGKFHSASPVLGGSCMKIYGNMSWRDSSGCTGLDGARTV